MWTSLTLSQDLTTDPPLELTKKKTEFLDINCQIVLKYTYGHTAERYLTIRD